MKLSPINRKLVICLAVVFFGMWPGVGGALDEKTVAPQETVSVTLSGAIPVAEVPIKAADALAFLRALKSQMVHWVEVETIEKSLSETTAEMGSELADTAGVLRRQATLPTLQFKQQRWQQSRLKISGWLSVVSERATAIRNAYKSVEDLNGTWVSTLASARRLMAPEPIIQQIESTVAAIDAMKQALQPKRDAILDLQGRLAEEKVRCDNTIAEIADAQRNAVGSIMTRSRPVWSPGLWEITRNTLLARAGEIAGACWADISQYVRDPAKRMPVHTGLLLIFVALFRAARRRVHRQVTDAKDTPPAASVFDRPYSSALLPVLFLGSAIWSPAPPAVRELFAILAIMPIIRIIQPVADPRAMPGYCALGGLFALDIVRQVFNVGGTIEYATLVLEIIGGSVALWKLDCALRERHLRPGENAALRFRLLHMVVAFYKFGLAISFPAIIFGYLRLARLLTSCILAGGVGALGLFAGVRVLDSVVALALESWPLRLLQTARDRNELIKGRIHKVMVWVAAAAWVNRTLAFVGLQEPVVDFGYTLLGTSFGVGSLRISVENVLAFFLTVLAAYLLSRFIRFVLQEDLYPRIGIERGLSFAISSLLHYTILALGFVLGMAALGVNLTQVSILAGAFGVGIGFGLQSVVNNFVSGLVLLFERPIDVGDFIQVGDLSGFVRRIGIRASTVRTQQGAEIIVPNAQLITERVINWTLSDRLRRIDLPVGINYGANPRKVIQLLEEVARRQPKVLENPAPRCLLIGYGDSSINFQLRAWTDQFDDWQLISSDLATAVYDAVIEAGLQFPFPQREVHVIRDSDITKEKKA